MSLSTIRSFPFRPAAWLAMEANMRRMLLAVVMLVGMAMTGGV